MGVHGDIKSIEHGGEMKQLVTSVTLVNNTVKVVDLTVPSGKKWLLKSIRVTNVDDVNRSVQLVKYKSAGKTQIVKYYQSATINAAGEAVVPSFIGTSLSLTFNFITAELVVAGNTLTIVWNAGGASAGGTDADGLVVEYLEWAA